MQSKWMRRALLAGAVAVGMCGTVVAQETAKQDMKDAGHDTKMAAKHTGHAVKKGTKKAYHKTKSGVHHTAAKVEQKTAPSAQ
ncbi:MAG TPA: hypothetical protein VNX22_07465 [Acidobacteriaceae bacterium]|nr:hypothetical protein [Acidobacteriaceae bacterium]